MQTKTPGKDMPYTTWDLFEKTRLALIENKEMPENLLDYALATRERILLKDCEFDIKMDVHFGGSEGIYLWLYLEGNIGEKDKPHGRYELGTFKTLVETKEALQQMALIGANFIYAGREFIEKNLDDFIWLGYKLTVTDKDGKRRAGWIIRDREKVIAKKAEYEEKYPDCDVVLVDLETRKEI